MKRTKKFDSDFISHAKKVMGEKKFNKAVKKGKKKVLELRLKMARELIGLNQTELKGMTQPEVSKIEKRKDLKISTLDKYAKAMGMKLKICLILEDEKDQQIAIYG
jgi:hypothetical protein